MSKVRKSLVAALATAVLVLGASAPAFGQSSLQGYNDEGPAIQDEVSGQAPAQTQVSDGDGTGSNGLPFTGLDVALLLGAGVVLTGAGLGMRRLARPTEAA